MSGTNNGRRRWSRSIVAQGFPAVLALYGCAHQPGDAPAQQRSAPPNSGAVSQAPSASNPSASAEITAQAFWGDRRDLIQPPPPPQPAELTLPRVDRWSLKNGLNVVAVPRQGLPIISFSVAIAAGGYDEDKDRTEGAAEFVAAMLRKGTPKRSAEQIADAIDGVGGSLDAAAGPENTTVTCSVLTKDAALCLGLLADVLLRPTFPVDEMPEIRDQMLAMLAARVDDHHLLAAEHFNNLLFGEDHPDGWVLTEDDVTRLSRATLVEFWRSHYRPNNAMLAVAGDFDVAAMKKAIAKAFAPWTAAPTPARRVFRVPDAKPTRALLIDKGDLTQATLMAGHPGIRHGDADWYAATAVNYVLGGSDFSSRLMTEVRSKRGLTYGIGSSFGATLYRGAFRVSAATRNETVADALTVTVAELRKMKNGGPTAGELAKAKGFYAGSIPFELESAAGLARSILKAESHGLGIDYVRQLPLRLAAVDQAAATAAANSRLAPDSLTVVVVGKAAAIEPQLHKAGIAFEKIDYRAPISAAARRALAAGAR